MSAPAVPTPQGEPFVTRFAPSPTGPLHLGHAFSAILAHDAARQAGGRFLLRIEDIDAERCRPQFADAILEDLAWLGLAWDAPPIFQSQRGDAYAEALESLGARGLLYRCFRTRAEIMAGIGQAPHGPQRPFFGAPLSATEEARRLDEGQPFAWRLSIRAAEAGLGGFASLIFVDGQGAPSAANPWRSGDVILARKGMAVAYHLAAVVDDAASGVTCVIRGEDLREACHVQVLLQSLLGLPTPAYRHHRLVLGDDGKRLAKRNRAQTLAVLRAAGATPADIRFGLGLSATLNPLSVQPTE